MPSVDTRTALAMSEVAKLELSFDDLMVRIFIKHELMYWLHSSGIPVALKL